METKFLEDERRWAQWMAQAQRGDREIYTRLLQELGHAIETYIRVRFGNIETLEDCVQECLITIHTARHTYDPRRLFRPWLFTLVRHKTIDVLRQRQTWRTAEQVEIAEPDTRDSDRLMRLLDGARILDRLAPDHREMVALAKYGGYTTSEAAAWLGISESAAKARLQRGLSALKKLLESEG